MNKLRVGILGQGRSGRNIHEQTIITRLTEKFEVGAVCDTTPERCEESKNETGCVVYTDYHEMLKDKSLDLIVNASMSPDHVPINMDVIMSGHNLLAEKPLARTVEEVDRMVAAARDMGVMFAVFQQSRFAPTFLKIKEVINSGTLGRIVQIKIAFNGFARRWDWQTLQCMEGGSLYNTGPHPLDQALQLFGDADPEVFCTMDRANSYGDAEDHVKVILIKPDHPVIDLEVSSCFPYPTYVYQVYGTNGGLTGSHEQLEWKYFKPEEAPEQQLIKEPMPERKYCSEELKWYTDSWESSKEEMEFNFRVEKYYDMLYDAMTTGKELSVTVEQVRRQIAVIEECHRQNPMPVLFGR